VRNLRVRIVQDLESPIAANKSQSAQGSCSASYRLPDDREDGGSMQRHDSHSWRIGQIEPSEDIISHTLERIFRWLATAMSVNKCKNLMVSDWIIVSSSVQRYVK
jgi:hypothetical protein